MPPAAGTEAEKDQVNDGGSPAPATREHRARSREGPALSVRMSVPPAGWVMAAEPRTATAATVTSPAAVPAGVGMVRVRAVVFLAELAARKVIPAGVPTVRLTAA